VSVTEQNKSTEPAKPPKPVKHRQWGGATAGLLLGVVGLAAGRLGYLYPHFDVFSQFSVQCIALVVAFTFAVFVPRFKTLFGVITSLLLLLLYAIWPHVVSAPLQQGPYALAPGERALRVAHFNTFARNNDVKAIAAELLRLDADVVSLVETDSEKKQKLESEMAQRYAYQYKCDATAWCDIMVLSKFPIIAAKGESNWTGPPFVKAKLGGAMSGVTVLAVHTTRFPHSRAQLKQVQALATLLEAETDELVVAGDFNATPFSRVVATLQSGANLTRVTQLPTWPAHVQLPQLAIDHVFVSSGVRVLAEEQIGNSVGSDHFPILITLGVKAAP
jgi:endonuclease/exonuclease/phosphatase (EEP) superfamily protein YafD